MTDEETEEETESREEEINLDSLAKKLGIGDFDEYLQIYELKQPPADGAWIVRNSWGDGYGNLL